MVRYRDPAWLWASTTVATDPAESYRTGLTPLADARRVADPFHVIRAANRAAWIGSGARPRTTSSDTGPQGRSAPSEPQAVAERCGAAR